MMEIRKANLNDLAGITAIYNDAIQRTTATFDTQPKTEREQQRWFQTHDSKHPIMVAEQGTTIVGWASLSPWSDRCAYVDTAEIAVYVKAEHRGRGIGTQLLTAILREGRKQRLHSIIARIAEGNDSSIHLFETFGFSQIGVMREVGRKFGKLFDVYLMQKTYVPEERRQ
jgi:phosphinothricin acetyltransferase